MAPSPFAGESREVDAGSCFDWLRQGWAMFLVNPGIWIGVTVLLLVILMAISIVPLFGQIAAHLLVPLFGAGMFRVCRRMSNNEEPEISDLFAGFHHQAGQLVMVGVFFAAGIFGIAFHQTEFFHSLYHYAGGKVINIHIRNTRTKRFDSLQMHCILNFINSPLTRGKRFIGRNGRGHIARITRLHFRTGINQE
mgnify:CR=1 FL=1